MSVSRDLQSCMNKKDFGAKELYSTGRGRCVNAQAFAFTRPLLYQRQRGQEGGSLLSENARIHTTGAKSKKRVQTAYPFAINFHFELNKRSPSRSGLQEFFIHVYGDKENYKKILDLNE